MDKPQRKYGYVASTFLVPARNAVQDIKPTLDKIERMAPVLRAAENIDLGYVEHVIEMDEELFRAPASRSPS